MAGHAFCRLWLLTRGICNTVLAAQPAEPEHATVCLVHAHSRGLPIGQPTGCIDRKMVAGTFPGFIGIGHRPDALPHAVVRILGCLQVLPEASCKKQHQEHSRQNRAAILIYFLCRHSTNQARLQLFRPCRDCNKRTMCDCQLIARSAQGTYGRA
jgi:hypothetical protein